MPEVSNLFVCIMGMGVTFIGLTCLIVLTAILGKLVGGRQAPAAQAPAAPVPVAPVVPGNRQETIAAVAACIAEDLGTDVSAIRILSFKKVS